MSATFDFRPTFQDFVSENGDKIDWQIFVHNIAELDQLTAALCREDVRCSILDLAILISDLKDEDRAFKRLFEVLPRCNLQALYLGALHEITTETFLILCNGLKVLGSKLEELEFTFDTISDDAREKNSEMLKELLDILPEENCKIKRLDLGNANSFNDSVLKLIVGLLEDPSSQLESVHLDISDLNEDFKEFLTRASSLTPGLKLTDTTTASLDTHAGLKYNSPLRIKGGGKKKSSNGRKASVR